MRKFTPYQRGEAEMAIRSLSEKAQKGYNGTSPLTVYKKGPLFFVRDMGSYDNLTEKELEEFLEALWFEEDEEEIE